MSDSSTSEEKNLPPSDKKLKDSRKKGQIPKSREMVGAVVTVVAFAVLAVRLPALSDQFLAALDATGKLAPDQPFAAALPALLSPVLLATAGLLGPLLLLLVAAGIVTNIVVNGGLVVAFDPLMPQMSRLNPAEGFQRLFALRNIIELVKTLAKLALTVTTAYLLLRGTLSPLVEEPSCGLACAPAMLRGLLQPLLIAACLGFLVIGACDIGIQRWLFQRDMRMTRSEQKRERKEQHGDPQIIRHNKMERRQSASSRMRAGLRNATFVVRSAEVSCAMRFAQPDAGVPILVARAKAEMAGQLVEEARRRDIPVIYDPALAALLDGQLKVGMMITKAMFPPVIACMRSAKLL